MAMKAVMSEVPADILAWRKRTGGDRWARPLKAKVYHNVNVASPGGWPHDYRIADLVLLGPERFGIDRHECFGELSALGYQAGKCLLSPGDDIRPNKLTMPPVAIEFGKSIRWDALASCLEARRADSSRDS
jgi:hypothetical protein